MSAEVWFIDTNILVYLFDRDAPGKKAVCERLLREHTELRLSTQVLQEFYVAVTRKLAPPLDPEQALAVIDNLRKFPVATISPDLVMRGIRRSIESKLSYWDALIVETALTERADVLVTEDLQDGWMVDSMRVWNPFTP